MTKEVYSRAIESIEIAFSIVEFTYRLQGGLELEGVMRLFQNEIEVKGTVILTRSINLQEAHDFLYNHLHSGLSTFWIAVDEALNDVFGDKNPEGTSFIDDFRAVIYMFRCAFAHKISQPIWKIKPKYRRSYRLLIPLEHREGGIEEFYLDFLVLHGQRLKNEEYKGFNGILVLSKVARELIKAQSHQKKSFSNFIAFV